MSPLPRRSTWALLALAALLSGCGATPPSAPVTSVPPAPPPVAASEYAVDDATNADPEPSSDSMEVQTASGDVVVSIMTGGSVLIGDAAVSRLRIVTDPHCVYCQEFMIESLPALIEEYVRPGRIAIELVYATVIDRDPTLSILHLCAASFGSYRNVAEAIALDASLGLAQERKRLLKKTGLDAKALDACLKNPDLARSVQANSDAVERVPTFSIGDQTWIGVEPLARLRQIIDTARVHRYSDFSSSVP